MKITESMVYEADLLWRRRLAEIARKINNRWPWLSHAQAGQIVYRQSKEVMIKLIQVSKDTLQHTFDSHKIKNHIVIDNRGYFHFWKIYFPLIPFSLVPANFKSDPGHETTWLVDSFLLTSQTKQLIDFLTANNIQVVTSVEQSSLQDSNMLYSYGNSIDWHGSCMTKEQDQKEPYDEDVLFPYSWPINPIPEEKQN